MLVVIVPVALLGFLILAAALPDDVDSSITGGTTSGDATFGVALVAVRLLGGIVGLLASAACFRALAEAYLGRHVDWRESLGFAAARFGSILWVTVVLGAGLVLAFVCLIIPVFYFGVAWTLCYPVLLFEGIRGRGALGRSHRLVKGRWWSTFGALFFSGLLAGLVSAAVGIVLGIVLAVATPDSGLAAVGVTQLTTALSQVISAPVQAAILTVVFFDLKIRKEGFDLEMLADRMAGGTAPVAPDEPVPVRAPPTTPGLGDAPTDAFGRPG